MLILNNGVPKSGSSWVQSLIKAMTRVSYPAEEWRNDWQNPSIPEDRLADYVATGAWREGRVLIKTHLTNGPKWSSLADDDIRIVVTYRNLPDSVLSWMHHQIRLGAVDAADKNDWLDQHAMPTGRAYLEHRQSWQGCANAHLIAYEDMQTTPVPLVKDLAAFLQVHLPIKTAGDIITQTRVKLRPNESPRDGDHVRSGGRSLGKEELPTHIYDALKALEPGSSR